MKYLKRHRINQLQSRLEGENLFPAGLRKAKRTKTFFRILVSTIRELDRYSTVLARCTSSKVQTVLKSDQCLLPVLVLGFPKTVHCRETLHSGLTLVSTNHGGRI
mmetsp:Transcript_3558/g.4067  ORF Transcript_3558/g.4067 Transcript_3558/m.4067 type:complete len:105 (-) Transcript_3558:132-446(-)